MQPLAVLQQPHMQQPHDRCCAKASHERWMREQQSTCVSDTLGVGARMEARIVFQDETPAEEQRTNNKRDVGCVLVLQQHI